MYNKLDLLPGALQGETNSHIVNIWLDILAVEKKDYSETFRQLCEFDIHSDNQSLRNPFIK
jgi:uncharacterized protein YdiU (UPF0061 family)